MRFIFALTIVWFCSCAFFNCWFYVVAQGGHSEGVGRRGGWLFGWLVAGRSCRFHWVGNFFGIWIVVVACRRLFVGCIWPCSLFYFHSLLLPPPPPHGFPFFIWQISAHAGPSLVSLKKDTIGAVAAACCLLSVFFFRSLVKWFPHIIAFVVRPTLAQWHAPSPCWNHSSGFMRMSDSFCHLFATTSPPPNEDNKDSKDSKEVAIEAVRQQPRKDERMWRYISDEWWCIRILPLKYLCIFVAAAASPDPAATIAEYILRV